MVFRTKRRLQRQAKGPRERGRCLGATARCAAKRLFLTLASTVFAQRKAGCRAAVRSEPVTWRSWMIPGCQAMQRNHCPPSPCCMDRRYGRTEPDLCSGLCDADVLRASQLQHSVQYVDRDGHLARLSPVRLEAQPVTDDALPSRDVSLHQSAPVVP